MIICCSIVKVGSISQDVKVGILSDNKVIMVTACHFMSETAGRLKYAADVLTCLNGYLHTDAVFSEH